MTSSRLIEELLNATVALCTIRYLVCTLRGTERNRTMTVMKHEKEALISGSKDLFVSLWKMPVVQQPIARVASSFECQFPPLGV